MTNKCHFKEEALPLELKAGHLDQHFRCPTLQVVIHEYL